MFCHALYPIFLPFLICPRRENIHREVIILFGSPLRDQFLFGNPQLSWARVGFYHWWGGAGPAPALVFFLWALDRVLVSPLDHGAGLAVLCRGVWLLRGQTLLGWLRPPASPRPLLPRLLLAVTRVSRVWGHIPQLLLGIFGVCFLFLNIKMWYLRLEFFSLLCSPLGVTCVSACLPPPSCLSPRPRSRLSPWLGGCGASQAGPPGRSSDTAPGQPRSRAAAWPGPEMRTS